MYNATNTGKEANAYLILYITMLPIFENTNFTAVVDFLRLTIPDIRNSDWKIFPIFRRLGNLQSTRFLL